LRDCARNRRIGDMNAKNFSRSFALFTILLTANAVASEDAPRIRLIKWGPVFQRPGFASVNDFVEKLRSPKDPWRRLLTPDHVSEYRDDNAAPHPFSKGTEIIYQSGRAAIVFADHKPFRDSPFCSVIFLLAKKRGQFHVADFIRRSAGEESSSTVGEPKILKLKPHGYLHLYFTDSIGGRRWEFDTDEFYIVRDNRFHQTLTLHNDGAYLSPADPYRSFAQAAEVGVSRGRPHIVISRSWVTKDDSEPEQKFSVLFRWNSRSGKFTSPKVTNITLKEPTLWTAEGLPKPPANRP